MISGINNANPEVTIKSYHWDRINLVVSGIVNHYYISELCLILKHKNSKKELYTETIPIQNNTFKIAINVMRADKLDPLGVGIYDIFADVYNTEGVIRCKVKNAIENITTNTKIFNYCRNRFIVYPQTEDGMSASIEIIHVINKKKNTINSSIMLKKIRKFLFKAVYEFCCLFSQRRNYVLFLSDSRSKLSGNLQFVYHRMVQRSLKVHYKFMFKSSINMYRDFFDKFKLAYYIAICKYIFIDDFYPMIYQIRLREGTELVQLWHAVGAFKTFGYSRVGKTGGPSPFSRNHKNYTKAIVSSAEVIPYYAEGFGISKNNVVATGIPRTDIFFNKDYKENIICQIREQIPLIKDRKVITFAPTFRGKGAKTAYYDLDKIDLDKLYELCKGKYLFIFKMHPFVKMDKFIIPEAYKDTFIDLSEFREINDLLFVTDILITDYSSTCFEFALLEKPMLFYAYDLEEYISKRDFYYNFEEFVPGKICRDFDQLINAIKEEDYEFYKVKEFKNKFFEYTDGKSTDRVIDLVFSDKEVSS
ncbi:MAG: CDP-glycerol glycerophosphotransferase family protein [Eubacteriales bacterium]